MYQTHIGDWTTEQLNWQAIGAEADCKLVNILLGSPVTDVLTSKCAMIVHHVFL